ncbi:hypothetical protein CN198_13910 [Sinorhizobium meliloti]|uniref:hypothetical protein n=1 Tax=Rhizobium meliloti TaxID=382 RepID=UPI000FDC1605|nr:hypothetical protein [Sinorhizobium meliloti]RVH69157.1 hypothetical protein CN198_13910 [Sinorhizobium meliloti]
MNGTTEYDDEIHFHCVSTSTDPEEVNTSRYFTKAEDAQIFAEAKLKQFAAVWLWERGDCGRPGYEDVWVSYWWSNLLAQDYGFGSPEGRGKGWVDWTDDKLPTDLKNSTHSYVPLGQAAKA